MTVASLNASVAASTQHGAKLAYAVPVIGFLIIAAFPYVAGPHYTILMFSAMGFAIALTGLNLLFGFTGLLSFGHAMFLAIGAYTAAYLTSAKIMILEVTLLSAAAVAVVVAVPIGLLCIRYVKIYFSMLTLAFSMLLYSFLFKFYPITGGDEGIRIKLPTPLLIDLSKLDTVAILTGPMYYYVFGMLDRAHSSSCGASAAPRSVLGCARSVKTSKRRDIWASMFSATGWSCSSSRPSTARSAA